jgi:hypothetical protein
MNWGKAVGDGFNKPKSYPAHAQRCEMTMTNRGFSLLLEQLIGRCVPSQLLPARSQRLQPVNMATLRGARCLVLCLAAMAILMGAAPAKAARE